MNGVGSEPTSDDRGRSSIGEQSSGWCWPRQVAALAATMSRCLLCVVAEGKWMGLDSRQLSSGRQQQRPERGVGRLAISGTEQGRVQKELKWTAGSAVETMRMCLPGGCWVSKGYGQLFFAGGVRCNARKWWRKVGLQYDKGKRIYPELATGQGIKSAHWSHKRWTQNRTPPEEQKDYFLGQNLGIFRLI
jgi:hypothetical protein